MPLQPTLPLADRPEAPRGSGPYDNWAHGFQSKFKYHEEQGPRSYEGDFAYSYAAVIGRRIIAADGQPAYILTSHRWSNSTSGHQSELHGAIPWDDKRNDRVAWILGTSFGRHQATFDPKDSVEEYLEKIQEMVETANRPRTKTEKWMTEAARLATDLKHLCKLTGFDLAAAGYNADDAMGLATQYAEEVARQEAERARLQAIREAELLEQLKEKLQLWRNNQIGRDQLPYVSKTFLRVLPDGNLQSSRGFTIPREQAHQAWHLISWAQRTERHVPIDRLGRNFVISGYAVNRIDSTGAITVGCHHIPYEESALVARQLGWLEAEALATA